MRNTKHLRQRGAALVVGMILLVVITLLAVVGMNISNTELASATGEQLRLRAFNAAESGLESRLQTLRTDAKTDAAADVKPIAAVENSPKAGATATDYYTTSTLYRGEGKMISRYSAASFAGYHFTVESTGTSSRNAQSVHTAGAYLVNGTGEAATFDEKTGAAPFVPLP